VVTINSILNFNRTTLITIFYIVTLFEFDERFAAYGGDFCFYDYKNPLKVPQEMAGSFDVVVADPPFLSEECLTKTAVTIRFLSKHKVLLCTGKIFHYSLKTSFDWFFYLAGATMTELAERLLQVKQLKYIPEHKNNLGNEFRCFTNYDCDL
jgi:EEF1A lysine methyltransferase 1